MSSPCYGNHRQERIKILKADPAFPSHWAQSHIGQEFDADFCPVEKEYRIPGCSLEGQNHGSNCYSHGGAYIGAKFVEVIKEVR